MDAPDSSVVVLPLVIALPLFNDWSALAKLLPLIDRSLASHSLLAESS